MKTKIKKLWGLVTVLLLSVPTFAYDFEVEGLYYDLVSLPNRTCKLTSGNSAYSGSLIIPESIIYEGLELKVIEIDSKAFNSNISELTIPATINTIPSGTITKCKLTRLIFQDGQTPLKIDDYVSKGGSIYGPTYNQPLTYLYVGRTLTNHGSFSNSLSLTEIVIGSLVTDMPYFYGSNKLETVYIPDNIINLPSSGLGGCLGLKTVYVGNGVSKIANYFFAGSTGLENVYLGNNVSELGWAAFSNCKKLTNLYIFSDMLTTIGDNTETGKINCLPNTISKIYVPNPSRYDNLLNGYYRENLITLNNSIIEYSGKLPDFSYKNNVVGANISFSSSDLNYYVGTFNLPIKVIFTFENGWSTSSEVTSSYTITPAPLTIIANDVSRKYGMENPDLTCSFFGFKNGETQEVLTRMPNVETTATISSNVGTYPIIPSGAEAQNYTFNYERGTLTITKAEQTIVWDQKFSSVNVGDVIELTATSSANLPIKYSSTDESIAEIFTQNGKKFVEFLKPGTVSLRASQEGNENFNEAERVSKSIQVDLFVSDITLNQNSAVIAVGNSLQLIAEVTPINATNKTLTWESSNTEIATVDSHGKVLALKQGTTVITAKSTDGSNKSAQCELTVIKYIEDISINITRATLIEGQSLQLEATVFPEVATNKKLEWLSSNEAVAVVSEEGMVMALSKGLALITVKSTDGSNVSASCEVTVNPVEASSVFLNVQDLTLYIGQSNKLTATVYPVNTPNPEIIWKTDNETVVHVDNEGVVTALSKGNANVTATYGEASASCQITVIDVDVSSIELSSQDISILIGTSTLLTAKIYPENATNQEITWSSSSPDIASVDANGKITALKIGETVITASCGTTSATCHVTVVPIPAEEIILNKTTISLKKNEKFQLTAYVYPDETTDKNVVWSSNDESIASVSENGLVTAIGVGTGEISAICGEVSAICEVVVTDIDGIGYIHNENEIVNVYNINGQMIKEGVKGEELNDLVPGIYIILTSKGAFKIQK